MLNILYTLIIYPLEQLIELCFLFAFRVTRNPGLSILGLSLFVNILVFPLYIMMEKHQQNESEKQKLMKRMKDNIKAASKGDKRHMLLSTLYRQHNYHPVYALRGSLSLIIQIPFFIAAYHFLTNLEMINGVSFGPIKDLGQPDMFIKIKIDRLWAYAINILPFVMTLFNLISTYIYTKNSSLREKAQLYGMAGLFLILLINSPSALVLYWTANNFISLVKNIVLKTKEPKLAIHALVSEFCLFLGVYLIFIHDSWIVKRVFFTLFLAIIPFLPFLYRYLPRKFPKVFALRIDQDSLKNSVIFVLSLLTLFFLAGFVIPSTLIGSSVQEFSFIGNYKSPFPFIGHTAFKAFGIFILWPLSIYFLFSQKIKSILTKLAVVISITAVINVLIFPCDYGKLEIDFIFSENANTDNVANIINLFVLAAAAMTVLFLFNRFKKIVFPALVIAAFSMLAIGIFNSTKIHGEFTAFQLQLAKNESFTGNSAYQFSKEGKNVLVIMLDGAISGYIPDIFDEKQELYSSFDGFIWYKNSISFGGHTVYGTPGLFGGYEYTPLEINARSDIPLVQKHNEALLMLPRIFLDQGYKVTITDPPYANYSWVPDLSIFDDYPEIHAENIIGKYNKSWLAEIENQMDMIKITNEGEKIKLNMIRFSFFKIAPLLFRNFVYDNGKWLNIEEIKVNNEGYRLSTILNYIALASLSKSTEISDNKFNTYTFMDNLLPHEPSYLPPPDYVPVKNLDWGWDNSFYNYYYRYDVNAASLLLLGKWFDFLKENDVYDNTRIIIVSDHGRQENEKIQNNIALPDKSNLSKYTALLLVKDFNMHGRLSVDDSFMTNADVPLIALEDIVKNPVNPWSGKIIKSDKEGGVTITASDLWRIDAHPGNVFNIKPNQWLHVHTNIYDLENWSQVTIQE